MIDHDPFIHLAAGRELGALDDAENIELDRHLVGCARCAAEARAFDDTMAGLALVAPARHPPRSLQGSIMTAIRAVTPVPDPMPSRPAAVMGGDGSSWRRWVLRSWPRPLTAVLAAALVIVSLGGWVGMMNLRSELDQQRASVAAAQSRRPRRRARSTNSGTPTGRVFTRWRRLLSTALARSSSRSAWTSAARPPRWSPSSRSAVPGPRRVPRWSSGTCPSPEHRGGCGPIRGAGPPER